MSKPIPSAPMEASLIFCRQVLYLLLLALAFTIKTHFSPFLDQNTLLEQPRHRILRQSQRVDQSSHTDTQTPQPEVCRTIRYHKKIQFSKNLKVKVLFKILRLTPKKLKIFVDIPPVLPPDTDNIWNSPRGEDTCCCQCTGADHHHHHCYQRPECPG